MQRTTARFSITSMAITSCGTQRTCAPTPSARRTSKATARKPSTRGRATTGRLRRWVLLTSGPGIAATMSKRFTLSLASAKTMADYDSSPNADPHLNGTIWAAGLWDLRARLEATESDGGHQTDLLVLKALLELG